MTDDGYDRSGNIGGRSDRGKPRVSLLSVPALNGVVSVLEAGAAKYTPDNWRKGMDWSRPYDSMMRHLLAWWDGEDIDLETGLSHLDHVQANAMFLSHYEKTKTGNDNRSAKQDYRAKAARDTRYQSFPGPLLPVHSMPTLIPTPARDKLDRRYQYLHFMVINSETVTDQEYKEYLDLQRKYNDY